MADVSPIVSVADTRNINIKDIMFPKSKTGYPVGNMTGKDTKDFVSILEKSISPRGIETIQPTIKPINGDNAFNVDLKRFKAIRQDISVVLPAIQYFKAPKSELGVFNKSEPPQNDVIPTGKSDMPIPITTQEATTGEIIFFQYL